MSFSYVVSNLRRPSAALNASLWGDLRDAVRSSPRDYTSGSLGRWKTRAL